MREIHGDKGVFVDLFRKLQLVSSGDTAHKRYRFGILGGDGVLLGVNFVGYLLALEKFGLLSVFEAVAGVSTSIPTLAFALAGRTEDVGKIYLEDCATEGFYKLGRRPPMCVDFLGRLFEERLNQDAVRGSRPNFDGILRNLDTGELVFFDMKNTTHMVDAMRAGIAAPKWSHGEVVIDDVRYGDAFPNLPLGKFIERHNLSHLIVALNYPFPQEGEGNWNAEVGREIGEALERTDCKVAIISGGVRPTPRALFDRDSANLRATRDAAKAFLENILKTVQSRVVH